jgi:hypothetical protein
MNSLTEGVAAFRGGEPTARVVRLARWSAAFADRFRQGGDGILLHIEEGGKTN